MDSTKPQIMTRSREGDAWEPAKVSAMMLEFAEPLLQMEPGPRTSERLRHIMQLASVCWNARLYDELGEGLFMRAVEDAMARASAELRGALECMLQDRRTRFADVPFAVIADVTGETADEVIVTAKAYVPRANSQDSLPAARTQQPHVRKGNTKAKGRIPSAPGGMMPFDLLFLSVAEEETRSIRVPDESGGQVPAGHYLFRELYCTEPRCDCRRVILQIMDVDRRRVAATINYAFEPSDDYPQITLDPLNPQSEASSALLKFFEQMIGVDAVYRARLIKHYRMWKEAVDDADHPGHSVVRSGYHDDSSFRAAFPTSAPVRRAEAKVGANDPCVCGSGRKYKRCCRATQTARN